MTGAERNSVLKKVRHKVGLEEDNLPGLRHFRVVIIVLCVK